LPNPLPSNDKPNFIVWRFSRTCFLRVHRFLFEDIYALTGKIRKEQIGKAKRNSIKFTEKWLNLKEKMLM